MRWHLRAASRYAFSVLALLSLTACGGAAPPPQAPAMMPPEAPAGDKAPAEPGLVEDEPPVSAPDSDEPLQQPVGGMELKLADDLGGLFDQFRSAELELQQAGNVCSRACRALRSMQRAASRMCELASSSNEKARCTEANQRYRDARDRVRGACQTCPQGPALDVEPDAG
jgi:hypothetical protein